MKKVVGALFCILMALNPLFCISAGDCATVIRKVEFEPLDAQIMMDKIVTESTDYNTDNNEITYDDAQLLMRIAMAEAESDGIEGKAMVMAVVLNRVKDQRFPDTVYEVITQDKQFSPIADGRFYSVEPDVECNLALAEIEKGNYSDVEALYFENAKASWQASKCTYLCKVGHHRFYK